MKKYLGKSSEPVTISRDGVTTPATWLRREAPKLVGKGLWVQEIAALTYSEIETGNEVVDAAGRRWVAIEVSTSSFGGQNPLYDVRLGAVV